jgi:hypothetical protein
MSKKFAYSLTVLFLLLVTCAVLLQLSSDDDVSASMAENALTVEVENGVAEGLGSKLSYPPESPIIESLPNLDTQEAAKSDIPRSYKILDTSSAHLVPPRDPAQLTDYYLELVDALRENSDDVEVLEKLYVLADQCAFFDGSEKELNRFTDEYSQKMVEEGKSHSEILEFVEHRKNNTQACSEIRSQEPDKRRHSDARTAYALRASDIGSDLATLMLAIGSAAPEQFDQLPEMDRSIFQESVGENLFRSRMSCNPQILRLLASGSHEGEYWTRPQSNIPIGIQKFALWRTLGLASFHNLGKSGGQLKGVYESNMKVIEEYNLSPDDIAEAEALADAGFERWCMED